jgi:Peptidase M15
MNLSEHFTLEEATYSETAVRMGIYNQPDARQLENMKSAAECLEGVRVLLGHPLKINSWLRLPKVNEAVGGSAVSAHMDGWAIDFTCAEFGTPLMVCQAISDAGIKFDQLIHEYAIWTHISFHPDMKMQKLTILNPAKRYHPGILSKDEYEKL